MSGGGRRSVGPPMSKFWSDLKTFDERTGVSDKDVHRPLGLCAPVSIRRNLEVTKRILLGSELVFGLEPKKRSGTGLIPRESQTHHE